MHATWISWLVVAAGASVLWSAVGIDRTRSAALRRRVLLGAGVVAIGFVSLAVTNDSRTDDDEDAVRVANTFTVARMTADTAGMRAELAPAAKRLADHVRDLPMQNEQKAHDLAATGQALDCGQTPILQDSGKERCVAYRDGSRVFLTRDHGRWRVAGFTTG